MGYNSSWTYFYIEMSAKMFVSVNVPLSAIGILLNMFFVFCMVFPPQGAEQQKRILKVLLGSLVWCNTVIHLVCLFIVFYEFIMWNLDMKVSILLAMSDVILNVMIYSMITSVTCCHWMNMFYFCQIVPPQHPFLIWFKRNIRALIYSGLGLNAILYVFGMSVEIAYEIVGLSYYAAYNSTDDLADMLWDSLQINRKIKLVNFWCRLVLFLLSVCVMLASTFATVLYLWRHMKNLEESGVSSPRLQRQIKIIIAGITTQAVLHFLCSNGILIDELVVKYSSVDFDWNAYILYTFISLYSFGTTINMGISQSLFRQGAVHVWQNVCQTLFLKLFL
ncbi:taste receptor type 2 member 8-like [Astyanax mexicanus]|uniref:Taste receptor type 2 n=1 Tax=Astyanax mexicanus TaxID=7994 RepID=A0A8T2LRZ9_ASTMX|nr:taste receptor type 2 member 8-like [Astyanax mexicanus]